MLNASLKIIKGTLLFLFVSIFPVFSQVMDDPALQAAQEEITRSPEKQFTMEEFLALTDDEKRDIYLIESGFPC